MLKVTNPADGSIVGEIPEHTPAQVDAAITRVADAFDGWAGLLASERAAILRKWHALVKADKEEFAVLMTKENGKCLSEARAEVDYGLGFIEWYAEEALRVYGTVIPTHQKHATVMVTKQAIGPVGAITPWNFPFAMITRKAATALAAGCSVVLKPPSETPLTALKLQAYARKAGLPDGVFEIVTGDAAMIGEKFTSDPRILKISFTGSTEVGRTLARQSAATVKKLTMELGGNAPFVIFADAKLDDAVEGLVAAKLRNSGQVCISPNRIYVQDAVFDQVVAALKEKVAAIPVDQGLQEDFVIGPLINEKGLKKVMTLVDDARQRGATVVLGGKAHAKGGLFYEPTILTDVGDDWNIARTEIFGPVFVLYRFTEEADVIRRANDSEFGLVAYAYTRDLGRAFRLSQQLEAGMVMLNSGKVGVASAPFGGVKQSGYGREGSFYGIEEYVQVKYVLMAGQEA